MELEDDNNESGWLQTFAVLLQFLLAVVAGIAVFIGAFYFANEIRQRPVGSLHALPHSIRCRDS